MSENIITEKTKTSLSVVWIVGGAFLGGAIWIHSGMSQLGYRQELSAERINSRLSAIESKLDNAWQYDEQQSWVSDLQSRNQGLKVPPAREHRREK